LSVSWRLQGNSVIELPSIALFSCCFSNDQTAVVKTKAAIARGPCGLKDDAELLGCHLFGFTFLPHQLQLALGFLEGGRKESRTRKQDQGIPELLQWVRCPFIY
jgi:hypothetical protein